LPAIVEAFRGPRGKGDGKKKNEKQASRDSHGIRPFIGVDPRILGPESRPPGGGKGLERCDAEIRGRILRVCTLNNEFYQF
jgi:hypothetical protein